jgi:hypothetical protein
VQKVKRGPVLVLGSVALVVAGAAAAIVGFAGGGDRSPAGPEADRAPGGRCDLGVNTAAYNAVAPPAELIEHHAEHGHDEVDFTVAEWAEVFTDPSLGVPAATVAANVEADPAKRESILGGQLTTTLDPDPWVPITDPGACEQLAAEVEQARAAAARLPTVADAVAAGYREGSQYAPGQGAHYTRVEAMDGTFDPGEPELLMYTGKEPGDTIVGVSYYLIAPEGLPADDEVGFTGPNDRWHRHATLCRDAQGVAVPRSECAAGRATETPDVGGWMTHAWVVPGCESDWGMFSGANPRVKVQPRPGAVLDRGCGSGRSVADPLALDPDG